MATMVPPMKAAWRSVLGGMYSGSGTVPGLMVFGAASVSSFVKRASRPRMELPPPVRTTFSRSCRRKSWLHCPTDARISSARPAPGRARQVLAPAGSNHSSPARARTEGGSVRDVPSGSSQVPPSPDGPCLQHCSNASPLCMRGTPSADRMALLMQWGAHLADDPLLLLDAPCCGHIHVDAAAHASRC